MRRVLPVALVLAACAAAPATARAPVAVGVAERDFRMSLYRVEVDPGPVRVNVTNFGEDVHNLVVVGPGGYHSASPDLRSGDRHTLSLELRRPGRYRLLCTKADHVARGMVATLRVRPRH